MDFWNQSARKTWASLIVVAAAFCIGIFAIRYLEHSQDIKRADKTCSFYFPNKKICVILKWPDITPSLRPKSFNLYFYTLGAQYGLQSLTLPQDLDVVVSLWMPGMGHGTSPVRILNNHHTNQVEVQDVNLSMSGEWEIWVSLFNQGLFAEKAKMSIWIN